MSGGIEVVDSHRGEPIVGECPHCRLPIYVSDPRRMGRPPWDTGSKLYHAGCAMAAEGIFYEKAVTGYVERLRGCGYVCELRIIRPVR